MNPSPKQALEEARLESLKEMVKLSEEMGLYNVPADVTPSPEQVAECPLCGSGDSFELSVLLRDTEISKLKAKLAEAMDALKQYDDLIKHNYSGTQDAMSDLTYAAQNGHSVLLKLLKD